MRTQRFSPAWLLIGLALALIVPFGLIAGRASVNPTRPGASAVASSRPGAGARGERAAPERAALTRATKAFGRLPLSFEANQGQLDQSVKFAARGPGYQIALTANEAWLRLRRPDAHDPRSAIRNRPPALVRMRLVNANPAPKVTGLEELPGKVNYFIGNESRVGITTYAKVEYRGVYPGVDLVYYGNQQQLEYDLVVAPGADPRVVRLAFDGVGRLGVDGQGELVLPTSGGELRQRKPFVYQEGAAGRKEVASRFVLTGEREVGFEVDQYDRSRPLVIDPALVYSTYLGGSFNDYPGGIAVDSSGAAYVTGQSESFDFPGITTFNGNRGVYKSTDGGGNWNGSGTGLGNPNVSALAIDPSALATLYAATDRGVFKSVDSGGNWSLSNNGLPEFRGVANLVISPSSPSTLYATAYDFPEYNVYKSVNGGGNWSAVSGDLPSDRFLGDLAVDPTNSSTVYAVIYEFGSLTSRVFKTTNGGGSWSLANSGISDNAFYLAIDPVNPTTLYASTFGGVYKSTNGGGSWSLSNTGLTGRVLDFAINPANPSTIYAAGAEGIFKSVNGGGNWILVTAGLPADAGARVVAIDPLNPSTLYASVFDKTTFLSVGLFKTTNGGSSWSPSNAGVLSNDIRTLAINPVNPVIVYAGAGSDTFAFAAKLNPAGSALLYSTLLGGGYTYGADIAVDAAGAAYLTGRASFGFPTTPGAYFTGFGFSFAAKLNAAGSLAYSTLIPAGNGFSEASSIATDSLGRMYIAGFTSATDFPVTPGAYQTTVSGEEDGFFMKINPAGGGASDLQYSTYLGGNQEELVREIAVDSAGRAYLTGFTNSTNFPTTPGAYQSAPGGGSCPDFPCTDAFVSKLNPAGGGASDLQYSTYLGGSGNDGGYSVAVDGAGKVYVTGSSAAATSTAAQVSRWTGRVTLTLPGAQARPISRRRPERRNPHLAAAIAAVSPAPTPSWRGSIRRSPASHRCFIRPTSAAAVSMSAVALRYRLGRHAGREQHRQQHGERSDDRHQLPGNHG